MMFRSACNKIIYTAYLAVIAFPVYMCAQTGSISEPVRYVGGVTIDPSVHEGRLRWAVGAESIQVIAPTEHGEIDGDRGWTIIMR